MKTAILLLAGAMLLVSGAPSAGTDKGDDTKKHASVWMKAKLEYSRNIQEGLTKGDFDMILKNANSLNYAAYLEALFRAKWPVEYRDQVVQFVAANKELIREAKAKHLLGATLAYTQLTVSCVKCHELIRNVGK